MKMKNKIFILLFAFLMLFFVGCENKKEGLYIDINDTININEEAELNIYYNGKLVTLNDVSYTLNDYSLCEIKDNKIIPLKCGKVTIGVMVNEYPNIHKTKTFEIVFPKVSDIIIDGKSEMFVNKKITLTCKVLPEIITSEVTWKSSNEDIIIVEKGVVEAIKPGSAKVIVKCEDFTKTFSITVLPEATSIVINGKNNINIGEISSFTYNIDEDVLLSSSDNQIVKVFDKTIMGVSEGSVTITAYRKDKPEIMGTIEVTVKDDKNLNNMTSEEKKIIDEIMSKMTLEQMVGEMFMVNFTSDQNWNGYTVPMESNLGLPMANFGEESTTISALLENYPIGNFFIENYSGRNKDTILKATKSLKELGKKYTKINPFIAYHNEDVMNSITRIPSNKAISSVMDSQILYDLSTKQGKQLNGYGINLYINNYLNYNPKTNLEKNNYSTDISMATNNSYIISKGLKQNNVVTVPSLKGYRITNDDRSATTVYNNDLTLLKNNIMNGCEIINIPYMYYDDIKREYTYLDKEFMQDLIRDKFNYNGIIMADHFSINLMSNETEFKNNIVKSINNGLDMIEIQIMFSNNRNFSSYYKSRALKFLDLYNHILTNVKNENINKERIIESNKRILLTKLRNNILDDDIKQNDIDFDKLNREIKSYNPYFITKLGTMDSFEFDENIMFISEAKNFTGTDRSAGDYFRSYFNSLGYKKGIVYHTNVINPSEAISRAQTCDKIYFCLKNANENIMVGYGKSMSIVELVKEIKNVNDNVCIIVIGDNYIVEKLGFVENFLITYNYYDDDFENIFKVLSGEIAPNRNLSK